MNSTLDHPTPLLRRSATAFVVALALALTLVDPTAQSAEAQVRGSVTTYCESQMQRMKVAPHTNAAYHTTILRRWDGQKWVGIRSTTTANNNWFVWRVTPGHYRVDVLAWTSASGWQQVSPVFYQSNLTSWTRPFMTNTGYCTVRPRPELESWWLYM